MKFIRFILFSGLFIFYNFAQSQSTEPFIDNLRCEFLTEPIGIDVENPRLSWRLNDLRYGAHQSSFQIKLYTIVNGNKAQVWDSGTKKSQRTSIKYTGPKLASLTKYFWTIKVQDMDQNSLDEIKSYFETGMMDQLDWSGQWITDYQSVSYRPSSLFRKSFFVEKRIKKARLYIANAGLHHLTINGEKASDEVLNPAYTKYDTRILYNTYDITKNLADGENVIGIELGNGWYNHQTKTVVNSDKAPWRNRPSMLVNIIVDYDDGSRTLVITDNKWKVHDSGTTFNSIFLSENYDFSNVVLDWDRPDFNDSDWLNAKTVTTPTERIQAQITPPIRLTEEFLAAEFIKKSNRNYLYKFPLNMAGITRITGSTTQKTTLKLVHSEQIINNNDAINNHFFHSIRKMEPNEEFHTDIIKLVEGPFSFQPKFNYKGFQYVEVISDQDIELDEQSVVALRVNSDMKSVGSFNSENQLLNKVWSASNNSYLSNMVGYPTDCPTREKNGWTGDAHFIAGTGLFNYESILLYEKWMRDHQDAQTERGNLPYIIPSPGWGYENVSIDWTASMILIPWNVYLMKGDLKILEENYSSMKRFLEYWEPIGRKLQIYGLGDWQFPGSESDNGFIGMAYYYRSISIFAKIAETLGKHGDFRYYSNLSIDILERINEKFYDQNLNQYSKGSLTESSLAIMFDIVPNDRLEDIKSSLSKLFEKNNNSPDVGVIGSKMILNAMVELGLYDEVFEMITKTDKPSWGHWINSGLTSFAEDWNYSGTYHTASLNHSYFGEINAWFYKALGGINPTEEAPGFQKILLNPIFDLELGVVEVEHESPYGWIRSTTTPISKSTFTYEITAPPGTTATLNKPIGFTITDYNTQGVPRTFIPFKEESGQVILTSGTHLFTLSSENTQEYPFLLQEDNVDDFGELTIENGKLYFQQGKIRALNGVTTISTSIGQTLSSYRQSFSGPRTFIFDIKNEIQFEKITLLRISLQYEGGQTKIMSKNFIKKNN